MPNHRKGESMSGEAMMNDQVCLVTGASSGIGRATAFGLAKQNANLALLGRNAEKMESTVRELKSAFPQCTANAFLCDLSSQQEIRKFAIRFAEQYTRLDVLIHNAGVSPVKRIETVDGLELTFAVNHLAPFLLTHLLLDMMKNSKPSRIIMLSSSTHKRAQLDIGNLQAEEGFKRGMVTYGHTKLMNLLFTFALSRRLNGSGVTVNAGHPGVVRTDLVRDVTGWPKVALSLFRPFFLSPTGGAETPIFLASEPQLKTVTGKYFHQKKETAPSPAALVEDSQEKLWDISADLAGLT
jgi:retinol dehydrogenase 12